MPPPIVSAVDLVEGATIRSLASAFVDQVEEGMGFLADQESQRSPQARATAPVQSAGLLVGREEAIQSVSRSARRRSPQAMKPMLAAVLSCRNWSRAAARWSLEEAGVKMSTSRGGRPVPSTSAESSASAQPPGGGATLPAVIDQL